MAYVNGFGQLVDGPGPGSSMDQQIRDMVGYEWEGMPKRLRSRNHNFDPQDCPKGYWATREGSLVRITAMSDSHLLNSIAWMERTYKRRVRRMEWQMMGYQRNAPDGAYDAVESALQELYIMESELEESKHTGKRNRLLVEMCRLVWPKYKELEAERKRRHL